MYREVRRALWEMAKFEDILRAGRLRDARVALWGGDGAIPDDQRDPFGAAKRTLYVAIRHQQVPLDFLVESDILAGRRINDGVGKFIAEKTT